MMFMGRARSWWCLLSLVLLAQGAVFLWLSMAGWYGWLPQAVSDYETTSIFAAPITAAAAAIAAGNIRLHGAQAWVLSGGRSRTELERRPFTWAASAGVLATTVLAVPVLVLCLPTASTEAVWRFVLSWGTVVGAVVCAAGFGVLLTRWLSPWVAPLLALVGPYLFVLVVVSYLSESSINALPVPNFIGGDYSWIPVTTFAARTAAALAVAAALAATFWGKRTLLRAAQVAASLAVALLLLTAGQVLTVPGAEATICTGSKPRLCYDATQRGGIDVVEKPLRAALTHLPTGVVPATIDLRDTGSPLKGALAMVPSDNGSTPARKPSPDAVKVKLGDDLFRTTCRDAKSWSLSESLTAWWRMRVGVPMDGGSYTGQNDLTEDEFSRPRAVATTWSRLPAQQQNEAITTAFRTMTSCTP